METGGADIEVRTTPSPAAVVRPGPEPEDPHPMTAIIPISSEDSMPLLALLGLTPVWVENLGSDAVILDDLVIYLDASLTPERLGRVLDQLLEEEACDLDPA